MIKSKFSPQPSFYKEIISYIIPNEAVSIARHLYQYFSTLSDATY